jgi:hypothetical protein
LSDIENSGRDDRVRRVRLRPTVSTAETFACRRSEVHRMSRLKLPAFKRGATPTIACMNRAKIPLPIKLATLISALQAYVDGHLAPVWGTSANLVEASQPRKDAWTLILLDNAKHVDVILKGADRRKVIGQHKLEHHGLPLAMVFVEASLNSQSGLRDRDKISVATSHELAEMLVDPGNNLWCEVSEGTFYAYEVCDPVEEKYFPVKGLLMSDFVYPAYFDLSRKPKSTWFDHMGVVDRPFQILDSGYMPIKQDGKLVVKHGSPNKKRQFAAENRELHRSEFR